ncbi:MAG: hypothetical protein ABI871_05220 [Chthoniobacterales bacterium]
MTKTVLQLLPRTPGTFDGVGDYALNLAQLLVTQYGIGSVFAIREHTPGQGPAQLEVLPMDNNGIAAAEAAGKFAGVVLHYANYGYQKRGVPTWLPRFINGLRRAIPGRLVTVFHELYASGPPWGSAFWLRPLQKRIATQISALSDCCMVSNETTAEQLRALNPAAAITVQPVPSTYGEPVLTLQQIRQRDPHRWALCGGTALLERSLRSFSQLISKIPADVRPRELLLLGGRESASLRAAAKELKPLRTTYLPEISAANASERLATCSYGWIDYFDDERVPLSLILKSSSFAAYCAHGLVPVFPRGGSPFGVLEDLLPGPFYIDARGSSLPQEQDAGKTGFEHLEWYHRRAAIHVLGRRLASLVSPGKEPSETVPATEAK